MPRIRNILLDRDGTVIFDKHYLHDPAGVELIPGAAEALATLQRAGMRLFILTNQSGIGRGYFSEQDFALCTKRLDELLAEYGVQIERTLHCPHAPEGKEATCDCRKPLVGMWSTLKTELGLLEEESVMIGDKQADVSLGRNAELAASILVATGKGEKEIEKLELPQLDAPWVTVSTERKDWPHCVTTDLSAAAEWILDELCSDEESE